MLRGCDGDHNLCEFGGRRIAMSDGEPPDAVVRFNRVAEGRKRAAKLIRWWRYR